MAAVFALTSFASTLVGGAIALRAADRQHLLLGLSAGVMLGLVAFDLLPQVFRLSANQASAVPTGALAFAVGFIALHALERWMALHPAHEGEYGAHAGHQEQRVGLTAALALAAHSFVDGVAIGLAFQVSAAVGVAVGVAVVAHRFTDGLTTVSVMLAHRNRRRQAVAMVTATAVAPLLGAGLTTVVTVPDSALGIVLGFFAGFVLYLATADILPEAHARHPSHLTLVATLVGVAVMYAVVALGSSAAGTGTVGAGTVGAGTVGVGGSTTATIAAAVIG